MSNDQTNVQGHSSSHLSAQALKTIQVRGKERSNSVNGDGPADTPPLTDDYARQCVALVTGEQHHQIGNSSWRYRNMQREPKPLGCNLRNGPQAKQLDNMDFYDPDEDGRLHGSATMNEMPSMLIAVCIALREGKTVEFSMHQADYTGFIELPQRRLEGTLYLTGGATTQPIRQPEARHVWTSGPNVQEPHGVRRASAWTINTEEPQAVLTHVHKAWTSHRYVHISPPDDGEHSTTSSPDVTLMRKSNSPHPSGLRYEDVHTREPWDTIAQAWLSHGSAKLQGLVACAPHYLPPTLNIKGGSPEYSYLTRRFDSEDALLDHSIMSPPPIEMEDILWRAWNTYSHMWFENPNPYHDAHSCVMPRQLPFIPANLMGHLSVDDLCRIQVRGPARSNNEDGDGPPARPGVHRHSLSLRRDTLALRFRTLIAGTIIIATTPPASSTPTEAWAMHPGEMTPHLVVLALAMLYLLRTLSIIRVRSAWTLLTQMFASLSAITSYVWLVPIPAQGDIYQPNLTPFSAAALHAALPANREAAIALTYEHRRHASDINPSNVAILATLSLTASVWTLLKLLPLARGPHCPTLQASCATVIPKEVTARQGNPHSKRSTARKQSTSTGTTPRYLNHAKWTPPPRPLSMRAAAGYAAALATVAGLCGTFLRMIPAARTATERGVETSVLCSVTGAVASAMLTVVTGATLKIHPSRVDRGPSSRDTRRRLAVLVLVLLTVCAPCTTSATVDSATPRYDVGSMKINQVTEIFSSHTWQWFMASRQSISRKDTRKIPAKREPQDETRPDETHHSVTVAAAVAWGPYLALTPIAPNPGNPRAISHSLRWAKGRDSLHGIHRIMAELITTQTHQTEEGTGRPDTCSHLETTADTACYVVHLDSHKTTPRIRHAEWVH